MLWYDTTNDKITGFYRTSYNADYIENSVLNFNRDNQKEQEYTIYNMSSKDGRIYGGDWRLADYTQSLLEKIDELKKQLEKYRSIPNKFADLYEDLEKLMEEHKERK